MALTRTEALTFLTEVLEIPHPMVDILSPLPSTENVIASDDELRSRRFRLLESIIRNCLAKEPFQSVTLMSTEPTRRRRPEWPEIKESMFLGQGGLCYTLNSFTFVLLASLGYDVSLAHSSVVCGIPCPDNHVVVLVHSLLTSDDLYLVDVGLGFAMARAVSLDFEGESPVFVDSYHTYKLAKRSKNKIVLLQQPVRSVLMSKESLGNGSNLATLVDPKGAPTPIVVQQTMEKPKLEGKEILLKSNVLSPDYSSEWREFYFFDPMETHKSLEEFHPCFDVCYGDVTKLTMHSSPRALSWPDGRLRAILHAKLAIEDGTRQLVKYEIRDIVEMEASGEEGKEEGDEKEENEEKRREDSYHHVQSCTNSGNGRTKRGLSTVDANSDHSQSQAISNTCSASQSVHVGDDRDAEKVLQRKITKTYQKLFPQFPTDMVVSALNNWKLSDMPKTLPAYLR